jgi:hypothetical protein
MGEFLVVFILFGKMSSLTFSSKVAKEQGAGKRVGEGFLRRSDG